MCASAAVTCVRVRLKAVPVTLLSSRLMMRRRGAVVVCGGRAATVVLFPPDLSGSGFLIRDLQPEQKKKPESPSAISQDTSQGQDNPERSPEEEEEEEEEALALLWGGLHHFRSTWFR